MDPTQTMPDNGSLCKNTYTKKEWLNYYKNVWTRNLVARCIDVETDKALKAINPEEAVLDETNREITVKQRLEIRKILVQDAIDLIAGIDKLLAIEDEKFDEMVLSKEALKVAEDMIPKKAGDICKTDTNEDGTLQVTAKDKLTCIPNGKTAEEYLKEKVEAEAKETGTEKPAEENKQA